MPLRTLGMTCLLFCLLASPVNAKLFPSRDRNRDRDSEERNDDRPSPPEVLEARAKADTSYQQGDYAKVIELTNWLIDNFPTDNVHFAYHLRASAKIELGKVAGSAKQVREGISDARAGIGLAGVKYPWLHIPYLYGLTALAEIEHRPEHAEMAIKAVTPVLAYAATKEFTEDDRAQLYYQRGLAYTAKRDFKLAAADFSQAVKLSPQLLGAHIKHAESLAALGRSKEALAAYDECVAEFPANLLAYNERGEFKRTTGDLEGAVSDFTRCLAIDSKFAIGYINRGRSLMQQNSPQAAEGDFSEALKLKLDAGTAVLARRLRAVARLGQGNTAAAITDLSAALKANPQDPTLYEERASPISSKRITPRPSPILRRLASSARNCPTFSPGRRWPRCAVARRRKVARCSKMRSRGRTRRMSGRRRSATTCSIRRQNRSSSTPRRRAAITTRASTSRRRISSSVRSSCFVTTPPLPPTTSARPSPPSNSASPPIAARVTKSATSDSHCLGRSASTTHQRPLIALLRNFSTRDELTAGGVLVASSPARAGT